MRCREGWDLAIERDERTREMRQSLTTLRTWSGHGYIGGHGHQGIRVALFVNISLLHTRSLVCTYVS